jgi:hypothetical protein
MEIESIVIDIVDLMSEIEKIVIEIIRIVVGLLLDCF